MSALNSWSNDRNDIDWDDFKKKSKERLKTSLFRSKKIFFSDLGLAERDSFNLFFEKYNSFFRNDTLYIKRLDFESMQRDTDFLKMGSIHYRVSFLP